MGRLRGSSLFKGYGEMIGSLAESDKFDFSKMLETATDMESKGYLPFGGYTYSTCSTTNYCAKFVRCVGGEGGMSWGWTTYTGKQNVEDISSDYGAKIFKLGE